MSLEDLCKFGKLEKYNTSTEEANDARSKRADAFYDHESVTSDTEYEDIFEEAKEFVAFVENKIKKEFPSLGKGL